QPAFRPAATRLRGGARVDHRVLEAAGVGLQAAGEALRFREGAEQARAVGNAAVRLNRGAWHLTCLLFDRWAPTGGRCELLPGFISVYIIANYSLPGKSTSD